MEAGKGGGEQTIRVSTVVTYVKGRALVILSNIMIEFGFMDCAFPGLLFFKLFA